MKKSKPHNNFKTPDGYFDNLSGRLLKKMTDKEAIPSRKSGFTVPDNYFEGLHDKIIDQLAEENSTVIAIHSYKKYYAIAAAVAATVLLIVGLQWNNTSDNGGIESLTSTDIESYFETNAIELSSYEIAEVLSLENIAVYDIIDTQLPEDQIIEYLESEIEDFDELNLEENE